jgi:CheY-like chemotaxis protein
VAHNFRNVLAGISANSQLIQMRYRDDQPLAQIAERLNSAVERGARLVDGLMQFSRKEKAKDFRVLDLTEVIKETYDLVCKSFDKKIDIQADFPVSISVMGDPSGLSQIFMNLCTNARDAMPDGGQLRIEARQKGNQAEVIISDTGYGMDKETAEKCFDPFFTTKEGYKGTGLGLSTTYGIVKEHGGDIHVYSELDKGTTLKIYLPLVLAEGEKREETRPEIVRGSGQKILIVDDEEEVLGPMEEMLEGLGYMAATASSGKGAIEKYKAFQPDVVLLDRNMPEMDGITCGRKIIQHNPKAGIVLLSGYDDQGPNGIDSQTREFIKGYLTKPVDMVELSQVLARLLK